LNSYNSGHGKVTITLLSAPATIELDRGLVAHYPMDNNSKDVIRGNDLTAYGDATLTSDRFGHQDSAYYFDGTGDYLKSSSNIGISGTAARTLVYWQKPDNSSYGTSADGKYPHIINWGSYSNTNGNGNGFGTYATDSTNHMMGYGHGADLDSGEPLTNQWENWAVSYDGSEMKIYKNGNLKNVGSRSLSTTDTELWVGSVMENIANPNRFFKGDIDEIRIYDRVLNSAEIQALYHVYDPLPPVIGSVLINNGADNTSIDSL